MIRAGLIPLARTGLLLAGSAVAALATWLLSAGPLLALGRPLAAEGPAALSTMAFPDVLAGCCAAALLAGVGWLLGTAALLALCRLAAFALPGSPVPAACARFAEAACPRIVRGAVVGVLGLGLGATVAGPALADASGTGTTLDGLAVPDRATGSAPPAAPRPLARETPPAVRVRQGDSLWAIASRLLPAGADDAHVTAAWHALHRANLARIGDDPDLILPGTRLVVPDLSGSGPAPHREEHP